MLNKNTISLNTSEVFFYTLFIIAAIVTFLIIKPFWGTIAFTLLLSAYFHPVYQKLVSIFRGNKNLASFITASLIVLLIIIPISLFLSLALNQAVSFAVKIVSEIKSGSISLDLYISQINNLLSRIPFVDFEISTSKVVTKVLENSQYIIQTSTDILVFGSQTAIRFFEQMAVFLFLLFGVFPILQPLKEKIIVLSPLPDEVDRMILKRVYEMGKAVFMGIIIVGFIQGIIGGIGFMIAGIPAVAFWMLLMIFLAVIPFVGPGFVLVPAVLITFFSGDLVQSLIIFITFIIAVNIDNYLRPLFVGKQTAIHPFLLIIALLGGLKLFGLIGVFFGPMVLVFMLTLIEAYEKHYVIKAKENVEKSNRD